ncbi:2'-5' RNA ligase family protein [Methanocella arvoryzae]|uniref:Calcineurin-like phosphoesterase domain-containing protein n=1 Tax=Methanocella arvoryzae (strain DSM 22066 / NBRC 105507 / MRE50) TaxID=351160 RepID=Q0W5D8_METAR|nr:2'-5' RNA ligase family protein [Methanocella arvoryzae]CAJ36405.1 conserved hypothetical protein [Methanocella arvoryzae MRE50]
MIIQVRIGPEKEKIKEIIQKAHKGSGLYSKHTVPHMTLYGDFKAPASSFPRIKSVIMETAKCYETLPFHIDGYDFFQGKHGYVCALKVIPSTPLVDFRRDLSSKMIKVAPSLRDWDSDDDFKFHITIAHRLRYSQYKNVRQYLETGKQSFIQKLLSFLTGSKPQIRQFRPYLPMDGVRITMLNDNRRIYCEYDLLQKRMLNRTNALNRDVYATTLSILRNKKGLQRNNPSYSSEPTIFLYSDTHFDHENIIRYCARPFINVHDMNSVLLTNWNNTISNNDTVYFLGDLVFKGRRATYWMNQLNGNIYFIDGNHDRFNTKPYEILTYGKYQFLLVHSPKSIPNWGGWTIHGHTHNNDIYNYPFINGETKTINVSAELVSYKPVDIRSIIALDPDSIKRMDTISSTPERW